MLGRELFDARITRLEKENVRVKSKLTIETPDESIQRLSECNERFKLRIANESAEESAKRRAKQRERYTKVSELKNKRSIGNSNEDSDDDIHENTVIDQLDSTEMFRIYEDKNTFIASDELKAQIDSKFDEVTLDMKQNRVCTFCDAIYSRGENNLIERHELPLKSMKNHLRQKLDISPILSDYYDVSKSHPMLMELKNLFLSKKGIYTEIDYETQEAKVFVSICIECNASL